MKKILIVDDEPDILLLIKARVESVGHQTLVASNGVEALKILTQDLPDLIITDVLMPEMDGFTFYKELKKSPLLENIPVLILTAHGKMEDSFVVMGVDDFVSKPFNAQELMKKVEYLLSIRREQVAASPGRRVLVAGSEDEAVNNMVLQLKKVECETCLVARGPEVISQTVLFKPQMIIMEVQMYDMPSEEIIRVLRQMTEYERTPILVYSYYRLSDLGSEDVRQKALSVDTAEKSCLEAGATIYLGRFQEANFMSKIRPYLEQK